MKIFEPEKFETEIIDNINNILDDKTYSGDITISEMTYIQRCFLNGALRQVKPKKILELGVSAGGSSAIILNSIKDIEGSFLYSIDYSTQYYRDSSKKSGFLVNDKFNNLSNKWKLYTGGLSAKFIDEIGDGIDFCLLDTMHCNPGEFIDFLTILPYLKKNAVLVIHDTSLYVHFQHCITCGVLFSSLKGIKMTPNENIFSTIGNIGLVILDDDIKERIFDYFYLLTLPWSYLPSNEDIVIIENFIKRHYGDKYSKMFLSIALHYKDSLYSSNSLDNKINQVDNRITQVNNRISQVDNKINQVDNRIEQLINTLAWWIPIKKKRDEFRKKFTI